MNQIYNNAGIAYSGDVEISQYKDIERVMDVDFWGCRQRHQSLPAIPDRVRRRPRHQRLEPIRHLLRAGSGRLQRGQVRGARVHRGSASGDDPGQAPGQGHHGAPGRHQDCDRAQLHRGRRTRPGRDGQAFDKKLARTTPERAAEIILDAVRKNKARVLVGADAKILDVIVRITGSGYQQLFSTVLPSFPPRRCAEFASAPPRGCSDSHSSATERGSRPSAT